MSEKGIILNKIISGGAMILAFLIPLFFLPFTYDFYEFNKNMLLFVIVGILLILWLLRMVLSGKISFKKNVFDLPVLLIAAAFILSTIFNAPNKLESLWMPGSTGTIVILTLLYFLITNNFEEKSIKRILQALLVSASLLSLAALYQFWGLKTALSGVNPLFPAFLQGFFPAGGLIPLATFLTIVLTAAGTQIYLTWRQEKRLSWFYIINAIIAVVGLVVALWQMLTTNKPLLLGYGTSWAIAAESFKNWRLFLLGIGPNSFLDAFTQFRPVSYNLTPLWTIRFVYSGNYYFHLLTTIGVLGIGSFVWLIGKTIRAQIKFNQENNLTVFVPLLTIFVIFLFLFPNFLLLFCLYLLLALFALSLPPRGEYSETSKIASWSIFVPITLVVIACFYFVGRTYAAEVYFRNSLRAFANNAGNDAYNNQIKAITLNPYNDVYRIAYSQTNLALANSLAAKPDLTDQDRQNITVLVQQAIMEAKAAVNLNQNKVTNWENLAGIYRQLLNFAQGADQWAITALSQAIKLDPNNPNLKLNLGGIYYALNNYDEAIRFFQQAIDVKPNFANGYYNLAATYREKGDFQKAHDAMQTTLNLVPSNSEDYNKARSELDDLAKKIPAQEATKEAELKTQSQSIPTQEPLIEPQPYPSAVITPPIELPEEQAAPEISPATEATP
jgi:tetratricopeptide (TPR) repeat protein